MNPYSCHSCQSPIQSPWLQPPAPPVVCPPQYRMHDSFLPRMQPVIHPIVNVNREHIVNVPQHFYTETNRNVVVPPPQPAFPVPPVAPYPPQQFFPGQPRF